MDNPILAYTTAFLDIGRTNWSSFSRSSEKYFRDFTPHLDLFNKENPGNYRFAIFVDRTLERFMTDYLLHREHLQAHIKNGIIRVILIDNDWMTKNIPLWRRLEREAEIVSSDEYKTTLSQRLNFPENNNPKYTLINHAKVDFLSLTANIFPEAEFLAWVDFGFFSKPENIPKTLLDVKKFPKGKITYTLLNPLTKLDSSLYYTLLFAPERIGGFFFLGDRESIGIYRDLFHTIHSEFQKAGLVDDDQHIALRCVFRNPGLFAFIRAGWHKALVEMEKKE